MNAWSHYRARLVAIGVVVLGIIGFFANITGILSFLGIDMASLTPIPTATIAPASTPTIKVAPSPTITPIGFELTSMTSTVERGEVASVTIQTAPEKICTLNYYTPKGELSDAQGLGRKTSDIFGICSWAWRISPGATVGDGMVEIIVHDVVLTYTISIVK
ncbi:MAG: hypothetical protein PVF74_15190 [Anaerolineales bacterium]|jgi:hypothetical protein